MRTSGTAFVEEADGCEITMWSIACVDIDTRVEFGGVNHHLDHTKGKSSAWKDVTTILGCSRSAPLRTDERIHVLGVTGLDDGLHRTEPMQSAIATVAVENSGYLTMTDWNVLNNTLALQAVKGTSKDASEVFWPPYNVVVILSMV